MSLSLPININQLPRLYDNRFNLYILLKFILLFALLIIIIIRRV